MIPQTFTHWHHCITVSCGIALTAQFLDERLTALRDGNTDDTRRFRRLYGDTHWHQTIQWFKTARDQQA